VKAAAIGAHAAVPALPVITGGLADGTTADPNVTMMQAPYLSAAVKAVPDLPTYVSGIGIHPYSGQVAPGAPGDRFTATLAERRDVRDRLLPRADLWATEMGYYTAGPNAVSEADQASWLTQQYDTLNAAPDVRAAIIHGLYDATWVHLAGRLAEKLDVGGLPGPLGGVVGALSGDPARSYGLLRRPGAPKPAFCSFVRRAGNVYAGC
jgi:hypothetical protein